MYLFIDREIKNKFWISNNKNVKFSQIPSSYETFDSK